MYLGASYPQPPPGGRSSIGSLAFPPSCTVMRRLLAIAFCALALSASSEAQVTVSYDEFGPMDDQQKIVVFNEVSQENRALLVRTQAERWLAAHRDRLSDEQVEAVERAIAFIEPSLYDSERTEAEQAASQEVMGRVMAVLSREEVRQAFTRHGAYIPPASDK